MIGTSDQKKVNLNFENIEHKKIGVHRLDVMHAIHKGIALQSLLLLNWLNRKPNRFNLFSNFNSGGKNGSSSLVFPTCFYYFYFS